MSWELVTVVVASIAGVVALAWRALPYLVSRGEGQRKQDALDEVNKRLDNVESAVAQRKLPPLGRRVA